MKRAASKAPFFAVVVIVLTALACIGFVLYRQLVSKTPAVSEVVSIDGTAVCTVDLSEAVSAVVSIDGTAVCTVDLSEDVAPYEMDLDALFGAGVVLEVQAHEIHFKSSTCPDQICVRTGWLRRDMDIAICMPNRVSMMIVPTADLPE
ncbi:MAG: NusG domain II-containing protein [Candidatus Fimivivens sp.]